MRFFLVGDMQVTIRGVITTVTNTGGIITTELGVQIIFLPGKVLLITKFGLRLFFDGRHSAHIFLPVEFMGCVYGLFQDFDSFASNDYAKCDGTLLDPNTPHVDTIIGNSCQVDSDK